MQNNLNIFRIGSPLKLFDALARGMFNK